jgi:hypothetical protein
VSELEKDENILEGIPPEVQEKIIQQHLRTIGGPPNKDRRNGIDAMVDKNLHQIHGINLGQCVALQRKAQRLSADNITIQLKNIL